MTDSKLNDRNTRDLKQRTKRFALDVIQFVESLPSGETSRVLGRQLLRSGTSVGANYPPPNAPNPPRISFPRWGRDRKSTRLNSSHSQISYAVFCLKKKK